MAYYLYILQSVTTNRYYIGQTVDVAARVAYHNANFRGLVLHRADTQATERHRIGVLWLDNELPLSVVHPLHPPTINHTNDTLYLFYCLSLEHSRVHA